MRKIGFMGLAMLLVIVCVLSGCGKSNSDTSGNKGEGNTAGNETKVTAKKKRN